MLLEPSSDQEFFRETTARYLADRVPPSDLRRLRHDPAGFDRGYWQGGAALGWTSPLVREGRGGGTISGDGLVDLTLVAHEMGRHAAPGPFIASNLVAAALDRADDDRHGAVLDGILSGELLASWCGPADRSSAPTVSARGDGGDLVLSGTAMHVESATEADHLLVTVASGERLLQVLVAGDAPGVARAPMRTVDLTRRFGVVTFDELRAPSDAIVGDGDAGGAVAHQLRLAAVLATAETVGAMDATFDMTVEWAFDRYTFGRPLASYQELKHRFADMKSWLEASHAISDAAAAAVQTDAREADELVSIAKAYVGHYGPELAQDCVQIHGGIGVTFEHDLHLFLRRITLDTALYGPPAVHRQHVASLLGEAA